ncbi:MAG: histidine kinase [Oscillospiraceae bacterium]
MTVLIDKATLLVLTILLMLSEMPRALLVGGALAALTVSVVNEYFANRRLAGFLYVLYAGACVVFPPISIYLALLIYDVNKKQLALFFLSAVGLLYFLRNDLPGSVIASTLIVILLSILMEHRTRRFNDSHRAFIEQRDNLKEASDALKGRISTILSDQDYEVSLATLNERNRIAREIHDNVGHVLAGSILQLGALITVTKDEPTKAALTDLKEHLTAGMESIRSSVHNLRDESIDLYDQLRRLCEDFTFCPIKLTCEATLPDAKITYAVLAVAKEALSNIIRHSDATAAKLTVREHPGFLQLVIADNGSPKETYRLDAGMGLENIRQRICALGGTVSFSAEKGFQIFASIPLTFTRKD